ncbi:DNA repair protein complementing XP-A cells homolog [Branchiostoma lanceolatum]|uniref:DNA repair protein complementing XP-A cells homolog n=1 Tax=Branchiostoma lanceolatum TaxID=7740 RepID=UPI0034561109
MAATTEGGSGANVQPAMTPESPPEPLSDAQRAKIERNRQRALLLRQARLSSRPYTDPSDRPRGQGKSSQGKLPGRVIDSGAGFLIEEDEEGEDPTAKIKVVHRPGPILEPDRVACELCNKEISDSFLFNSFDVPVCDGCKDMEEKHKLITKTEAKQEFLLKDCDFDQRDPPLKCIIRKNPHNQRWGDMKLFLLYQVRKRAHEVWGDDEGLEQEKKRREENKRIKKQKKFDKDIKELRKAVRSSTWTKDTSSHQHEFGPESYDEDSDMYSKKCATCGFVQSYEKM